MKHNIKDIQVDEWQKIFVGLGLKKYNASQVFQWLFKKCVASFDEMTDLSREARGVLSENFFISRPKIADTLESKDGTKKYLFELEDKNRIESVLIVAESGRVTLCISSQVGCALKCGFCRTAGMGFVRNLTVSEILDQVIWARSSTGSEPTGVGISERATDITNIVFMGMGEPLNNYENVVRAVRILMDPYGFEIAKRKITISTAGIVPGIDRMAVDRLGVKLAISLNATTDEVRRKIMPIANTYTIDQIINACLGVNPKGGRWKTTFEYVLIDGINDSIVDAKKLVYLMERLPSKVNLIPFNPYPECGLKAPKEMVLKEFFNYLYKKGIQVNTRMSRGQDILAACGQLASKGG